MTTVVINSSAAANELSTLISSLTLSTESTNNLALLLKTASLAGVDSSAIKTELLSRINAISTSTSTEEFTVLCAIMPLITANRAIFVADLTALNALSVDAGTVCFVESENIPYVYKSNETWVRLFPLFQGEKPVVNAYAWGSGDNGRLGDNTTTSSSSPVSVVGGFTDWTQLDAGAAHSVGVRANGSAWAWGYNSQGQLGDNNTTSRSSPVSVVGGFTDWTQLSAGGGHSLGLRANGSAWAWGVNLNGRLGDNTTTSSSSPVSVVGGFTDWTQLSAGGGHSLGLHADGGAWAWGSNYIGQLGDGTSTDRSSPVSVVGGFTDWTQLSAGGGHSLGLRANGSAWAWGSNFFGELGDNSITARSSPVSVVGGFTDWAQLSAGGYFSLGLRANGSAWAWGFNFVGQLGDGTSTTRRSPVSVVGGFTDWVELSAGGDHSVGLRANGTAWAWGTNTSGQLGDGTDTAKSSPVSVIGGFTDWLQISAGGAHNLSVRAV